ncbi:MAG: hypothetical protein JST80_10955 [Bdellovibrionales bacterium]|nr:hypothetical protein [Bdellovibrionales bacterium]
MKPLFIISTFSLFWSLSSHANLAYRLQSVQVVGYDEQNVIVKVPGGKANFKIPRKMVPERNVAYRGEIEVVTGEEVEIRK